MSIENKFAGRYRLPRAQQVQNKASKIASVSGLPVLWLLLSFVMSVSMLGSPNALSAQEANEGQAESGDTDIDVMTFNIRYNNPRDGDDAWPHRKDIVADVIKEFEADLIGMQEARPEQIKDLEERLPDHAWFGAGRDDGKSKGEHVPIFYRKDRFEILDSGHFWLSETPEIPGSMSWDTAITRMATWLKLRDRDTERELFVLNTHFDHIGSEARKQSAIVIQRQVAKLAADLPVVITGDFNCGDKDAPYLQLTEAEDESDRFKDSRAECNAVAGPDSTWNGFDKIIPGRRIDFIFVKGGWWVIKHQTIDKQVDGHFPSDHLPVCASLRLRDKE